MNALSACITVLLASMSSFQVHQLGVYNNTTTNLATQWRQNRNIRCEWLSQQWDFLFPLQQYNPWHLTTLSVVSFLYMPDTHNLCRGLNQFHCMPSKYPEWTLKSILHHAGIDIRKNFLQLPHTKSHYVQKWCIVWYSKNVSRCHPLVSRYIWKMSLCIYSYQTRTSVDSSSCLVHFITMCGM